MQSWSTGLPDCLKDHVALELRQVQIIRHARFDGHARLRIGANYMFIIFSILGASYQAHIRKIMPYISQPIRGTTRIVSSITIADCLRHFSRKLSHTAFKQLSKSSPNRPGTYFGCSMHICRRYYQYHPRMADAGADDTIPERVLKL